MKKFPFFILRKDWNTGKMEPYDVMLSLYGSILTTNNKISKKWLDTWKVNDKKSFEKFVKAHFMYCYGYKCEWEFITRDWPTLNEEKDMKVDGYMQLEPNISLIVDLVWEQIKDKLV